MCGNCNDPRPTGGPAGEVVDPLGPDSTVQPVRATIEPGFAGKVSIRFVPGRDPFTIPARSECAPRGDRPFVLQPLPFPPDLVVKLAEANKTVSAWLAKDPSNAQHFVDDPVAALGQAGIDLTRAEAKAVSRSHAALKEDAVFPPGAHLSNLEVTATARGKVGDARPGSRPHDKPTDNPGDTPTPKPGGDAGCGC